MLPALHQTCCALLAALWISLVATNPASAQQPTPGLPIQLATLAAAHNGEVAFYAEDLQTHQTVSRNPDTVVQTASTIKLAILYEALEQLRAGKVALTDRITLTPGQQVPGSGILLFFDTPLPLTFKDVLTFMVVMSDNTATNLAIDHLGLDNINARLQVLGLSHTYLYKKLFTPVPPGTTLPADQPRFGLGKTTPREMASLMGRLARCDLGSPALPQDASLCATALHMLHLQFYRDGIPRYLDTLPGATPDSIASKTGALDAARSDVAAISTRNGMVLMAIYTYDNQDHSWTADAPAQLTIAVVARAIIAAWSPAGLAPWPAPALTQSR